MNFCDVFNSVFNGSHLHGLDIDLYPATCKANRYWMLGSVLDIRLPTPGTYYNFAAVVVLYSCSCSSAMRHKWTSSVTSTFCRKALTSQWNTWWNGHSVSQRRVTSYGALGHVPPSTSSCLIFQVTSEPYKLWHLTLCGCLSSKKQYSIFCVFWNISSTVTV